MEIKARAVERPPYVGRIARRREPARAKHDLLAPDANRPRIGDWEFDPGLLKIEAIDIRGGRPPSAAALIVPSKFDIGAGVIVQIELEMPERAPKHIVFVPRTRDAKGPAVKQFSAHAHNSADLDRRRLRNYSSRVRTDGNVFRVGVNYKF